MWREAMKEMCADCPFGRSPAQQHMRDSLRPGRFTEICQSVWMGGYFPCHKTTKFDDDDEPIPHAGERMCRGALEFIERETKRAIPDDGTTFEDWFRQAVLRQRLAGRLSEHLKLCPKCTCKEGHIVGVRCADATALSRQLQEAGAAGKERG